MAFPPSGGVDKKLRRGFFAYYPVEALDCLAIVISKARTSWYDSFPFQGMNVPWTRAFMLVIL